MPHAIRFTHPGGPDMLRLQDVEGVEPGPEEVRITVHAAGINNADLLERRGHYPVPPGAPPGLGLECAGVIDAVGRDVTTWNVGDRVCALLTGGGYAEQVVTHAGQVMPIPRGLSMVEAAALPEVACTVYSNLGVIVGLEAEQAVLIHGGAGGIGSFAVQWAAAIGARVIATAGSEVKMDAARTLGADVAINYRTQDFVRVTLAETDGWGVDAILDIIGAPYLARNVECLAPDGHLVTIGGAASSTPFDLWALMSRRATVSATLLRARPVEQKAQIVAGVVREVFPLIEAGLIRAVVDRVFPLENAAAAHDYLERGGTIGKVVLKTNAAFAGDGRAKR
ncbi:NAD(P)H-quinone oxidoreductase [Microbacterium sp. 1P10UB]|uniref:NAD(P)H-quinone oxidoreductase n=1 Tax=unclassified Microbacterium TaxID=2609290 RepID=UPI0039A3EDBC